MALNLPRLPAEGLAGSTPEQQQVWWQQVVDALEAQEQRQDETIAALEAAVTAIEAAQAAAAAAAAAAQAADDAAAAAQAAASTAQSAADDANATIAQIESGTLDLDAITVGGKKFIYDGTDLVPEV